MVVQSISAQAEFQELVNSGVAIAVDFYAVWCGPCRVISPRFEMFSEKYTTVKFIKVDVDQAPAIAQSMEITAMPTFIFFKGGQKVATVIGADPSQVEAAVSRIA